MQFKIGNGIDFHQLVAGLPLIIGGITIPYDRGSKGHSDGDVLIHAIIDSILGPCNLGDLGRHFPATDDWKNASGADMLTYTYKLVTKTFPKIKILNIDSTIICEFPKINPDLMFKALGGLFMGLVFMGDKKEPVSEKDVEKLLNKLITDPSYAS